MAITNPGTTRSEGSGSTLPPPQSTASTGSPIDVLSSQLVQLSTVIGALTARMDGHDFQPNNEVFAGRPPPEPPFVGVSSVPSPGPLPLFTYTPTPSIAATSMGSIRPPISTGVPQTLGMFQPRTLPSHVFADTGSPITAGLRPSQPVSQSWQCSHPDQRPLSRPQMVSSSSCWGPPYFFNSGGTCPTEQRQHKTKMEPPRFNGTEVNNWIRGVQFYFDHVGTPEAQRLHYVIMLFEPNVQDWIWNYCSSHEFVTWFEFLDDVRRRFDPQCYVSHVGLLKKLLQTGTISEYQLAFEKLQTKVVGVPNHYYWTCMWLV